MKIKSATLVMSVILSMSTSYAACDEIEGVFQHDTDRFDTLHVLGEDPRGLFSTNTTLHVPIGWSQSVSAKRQYHCSNVIDEFTLAECLLDQALGRTTGEYAFWEYSLSTGLNFLEGFSRNRTISYVPSSRGLTEVGLVVIDEYAKHPDGRHTPFCESTLIYAQSMPKLDIISSVWPTGIVISAEVRISYDTQYSAYAVAGQAPAVVWRIENVLNPAEVYEVSTPHGILSFSPPFRGSFDVTATLYDGTYEAVVGLGNIIYTGGSGGGGIIQP